MNAEQLQTHNRNFTDSQLGDYATVYQGDVHHHHPSELPQPRKQVRLISYPRNQEFVDRPDLVEQLNALLPQNSKSFNNAALSGLGGSGKTQIALEHAYRQSGNPSCSVFWVHADTRVAFIQDYKKIAALFGLAGIVDGQDSGLLRAVSNRIQSEPEWLLVLDNADDLSLFDVGDAQKGSSSIVDFVPNGTAAGTKGSILWTSRDGRIAGSLVHKSSRIDISRMTSLEARNLLAIARGIQEKIQDEDEDDGIEKLLEELQWLPLGISQAGAYMRRAETTVREYLAMLSNNEERWPLLKEEHFEIHRKAGVPNSILKIWSISIARIAQENLLASELLHVMAYFDNRDMAYNMIAAAARHLKKRESPNAKINEVDVKMAIIRLKEFSFIRLRDEEKGSQIYEMHKLVQEATQFAISATRKSTNQDEDSKGSTAYLARIAIQVVDELFQQPETEYPEGQIAAEIFSNRLKLCEKYFAHVLKVAEWVADWVETYNDVRSLWALLYRVSNYLHSMNRWKDKASVDSQIFKLNSRFLGPNNVNTIRSEIPIAQSYYRQGRYSEAEEIEKKVFEKLKTCLGEQHFFTLEAMLRVANLMCITSQFESAEKLQAHALQILEKMSKQYPMMGQTMMGTLMIGSLHCLARAYYGQRKFEQVGEICTKSLIYCRDNLGSPRCSYYALSAQRALRFRVETLVVQGYLLSEAIRTVEDLVSEICDTIQKYRHLDEVARMEMLARMKAAAKKYMEAMDMQVKVVEHYRQELGENHPQTIMAMEFLTVIYYNLRQFDKAEPLLVKIIKFHEDMVGEEHARTLTNMMHLLYVYRHQGRSDESDQVQDKVSPLFLKILGRPFLPSDLDHNDHLSIGAPIDTEDDIETMQRQFREAMSRQDDLQHSSKSWAASTVVRSWIGQLIPKLITGGGNWLNIFGLSFSFISLFLSWEIYFLIAR